MFWTPWQEDNKKEPDFVNELGHKWWKDESTTKYATQKDSNGTSLDDAAVWFVEMQNPNGTAHHTRVLVMNGGVKHEDQSLEGMAVMIDTLKFLKRDELKNAPVPVHNPAATFKNKRQSTGYLRSKRLNKTFNDNR